MLQKLVENAMLRDVEWIRLDLDKISMHQVK